MRDAPPASGHRPQISWNLAIADAHVGKVADAQRELVEYKKRIDGLPTARWLRYAVGIPVEDYAREVGGPFFARLPDHAPEAADAGLPMTEGVRSANLIDPTAIGAPGVSTIRTSELLALIGDGEPARAESCRSFCRPIAATACASLFRAPTLFQTVSKRGAGRCETSSPQSPGRPVASWRSDTTRDNFRLERTFLGSRYLAIELVALGYPNVSWYRGGLEAWDVADLKVTRLK